MISASGGRDNTTYMVDEDMMTAIYSYTHFSPMAYSPEITSRQLAYGRNVTTETS